MAWLLDDPNKEYIESVKTDVMKTWRKFGFVPPSELKTGTQTTTNGTTFHGDILKEGTPQCDAVPVTKS